MDAELRDGTFAPASRSFEQMTQELELVFSAAPLALVPTKGCRLLNLSLADLAATGQATLSPPLVPLEVSFFHGTLRLFNARVVTSRRMTNLILSIINHLDQIVSNEKEILDVFVRHYTFLWSPSPVSFNTTSIWPTFTKLSSGNWHCLTCPFSHDEIWQVIKQLPNGKNLGLAGFTAEFFKAY
ncbi:hypothetical protein Cni_G02194 [Canna indica]|uniref:Uncharacterized protein n=1 Tax=Canna indica TaxID=4628 RepID=A0AAQ3JPL8_9LILI|nr:hypothetical protein Cni_G02194 [Canna indica]